jgi:putative PEP-CTERM system TPR-repeat lipoprotein
LVVALFACSSDHSPLDTAQRLYASGELDAARRKAGEAIARDPLNAEALLLLGRIQFDEGDGNAAERDLQKALTLGIGRARVDPLLAKTMLMGGHYARLLEEIKPSQDDKTALAGVLTARGTAHLALGQVSEAQSSFAEALKVVPDFPDALLAQVRLAWSDGSFIAATDAIRRVLAKDPNSVEAWLLKAELLQGQGDLPGAAVAYEAAARLAPASILPRLALASIAILMEQPTLAQRHLDDVFRSTPSHPAANYMQALLHFSRKNYPRAQEFAEMTLRVAPEHRPAAYLLASAELAQGAVEDAEYRVWRILQETPNDLRATKLYVAALLRMNNFARAIRLLEPLAQTDSDQELVLLAGQAHMLAGNFARASRYLERAAALQTDRPDMRVRIGLLQLSHGAAEPAIAELERAALIERGDVRAKFILALVHLRRAEFDKALQHARSLQQKQPRNPIAFNLAGAAHAGKGDHPAARASFEHALALDKDYLPAVLNLALVDLNEGKVEKARQRVDAVLVNDPGNVDAISMLARLNNAPGELVRLLQKARKADQKAVAVRVALARHLLVEGDTSGALEAAVEANAIAPGNAEALDALGAVQLASGMSADAEMTYEKLVRVVPDGAGARYRLAQAYVAGGRFSAAEEQYRRAIGLKPGYVQAMTELARLYARRKQFEEAARIADEIAARQPNTGAGEELRGDLLASQMRYAEAAKAYDAAYAVAPSGARLVKHHGALRQAALPGAGPELDRLRQWLAAHPDDHATRHYVADQQLAGGAAVAAIENYRLVIKADQRNAFALNNLALAYMEQEDPRAALAAAESAYKLQPEQAQIADTLGWLLVQGSQLQRGLAILQKAGALDPGSAEIGLHLVIAMARAGDKQGARALMKRLIDTGREVRLDPATRELLRL